MIKMNVSAVAMALVGTIAVLSISCPVLSAPAATTNLYAGNLTDSSGRTVYESSTAIDQKLGIDSNGDVVSQSGAPYPNSCYRNLMWNGPWYNEDVYNGQREAYIYTGGDGNDVRSEGMGYALMIAVQANDQYRFNLLHNFVLNHMKMSIGFLIWHVNTNGTPIDTTTAFAPDGDEWYTTSLIMAQHRWGGNYINEAWSNLYQYANSNLMFDPGPDVVEFWGNQASDPSYVNPAFYLTWWSATGNSNSNYSSWISETNDYACWNSMANAGRNYLNTSASLIRSNGNGQQYEFHPDSSSIPGGQPWDNGIDNGYGLVYGADAQRTTMNAALDAQWYGQYSNNTYWRFCRDRQDFYYWGNPRSYGGGPGEVAMNTAAGEAYTWSSNNGEAGSFAEALWNYPNPGLSGGAGDYYNAYLYYLGLLISTGRFKNY